MLIEPIQDRLDFTRHRFVPSIAVAVSHAWVHDKPMRDSRFFQPRYKEFQRLKWYQLVRGTM